MIFKKLKARGVKGGFDAKEDGVPRPWFGKNSNKKWKQASLAEARA